MVRSGFGIAGSGYAMACGAVLAFLSASGAWAAPVPSGKIHASIDQRLTASNDGTVRAWVFFSDKGFAMPRDEAAAARELGTTYDSRALTRRRHRRTDPGLTDARDLPVAPRYLQAVSATGATVRHSSRWLNAVSVVGTRDQMEKIAALPMVTKLQAVRQAKRVEPMSVTPATPTAGSGSALVGISFYGESEEQIMQINLDDLHNAGFTGNGVVVGILDTGFLRVHDAFNEPGHPVQIVAEHDFINNDGNTANEGGDPFGQHNHGTWILGTLGAYKPMELVGGAYNASFILCKTEDISSETPIEEDNYVAGLEFIELNGGDMATASLGYIDWYTQADLDGLTAVTTIAVNTATANGMYCTNSAGNNGHDANPATSDLNAPADALQVLSVGAVDNTGAIAGFSSDGPSADGRVKPEILARGINTRTVDVNSTNLYVGVGGTSLSCPLAAGAVACLIGAHPTWSVDQMRTYLMLTADYYKTNGTYDPQYVRGFGVINAFAASQQDCDGNLVNDLTDIASLTHPDCNANSIPDLCDLETEHSRDVNVNSIPDECEPPPPNVAPAPHDRRKNRYISFTPNNPGASVAFRVGKTTSPTGSCWVQTPILTPGNDQYTATCGANPVFRVWTEPVIHVGDCEIIPVVDYTIFTNAPGPIENPTGLAVPTILLPSGGKLWGDNVGSNNGSEWTPPNQITNVNDVTSLLAFISGAAIKPHFTVANLQAISSSDPCLNAQVNASDVLIAVQAIAGGSYGPPSTAKTIDPAQCPVCP